MSTGQGLLGNNMFAYCGNNPVNSSDSNGLKSNNYHILIDAIMYEGCGGGNNSCGTTSSISTETVNDFIANSVSTTATTAIVKKYPYVAFFVCAYDFVSGYDTCRMAGLNTQESVCGASIKLLLPTVFDVTKPQLTGVDLFGSMTTDYVFDKYIDRRKATIGTANRNILNYISERQAFVCAGGAMKYITFDVDGMRNLFVRM